MGIEWVEERAASPRNGSVGWEPFRDGVSAASLPIATPSEDER